MFCFLVVWATSDVAANNNAAVDDADINATAFDCAAAGCLAVDGSPEMEFLKGI